MKKMTKVALGLTSVAVLAGGAMGFSACGAKTYTGEYKYENPWAAGSYYGMKVEVEVKGNKVVSVKDVTAGAYTVVSAGWADKATWDNGVAGLLAQYEGKTVTEIMNYSVTTAESGQPSAVSKGAPAIAGATQGSGRLLLAVQDALDELVKGTVEGEYKYENPWAAGSYYGMKVKVEVKNGKIASVEDVTAGAYTVVSDGWTDKAKWNDGVAALLQSYVGKSVAEVKAYSVTTAETGVPSAVSKGAPAIAGATQGSGRLLLAVQNALTNF